MNEMCLLHEYEFQAYVSGGKLVTDLRYESQSKFVSYGDVFIRCCVDGYPDEYIKNSNIRNDMIHHEIGFIFNPFVNRYCYSSRMVSRELLTEESKQVIISNMVNKLSSMVDDLTEEQVVVNESLMIANLCKDYFK